MSVDLWIDQVARHARVILVRILGGNDWWRYGCDRLAAMAREHGIALALLPGEARERDERLADALDAARARTRRPCSPSSAKAERRTCAALVRAGWRRAGPGVDGGRAAAAAPRWQGSMYRERA